MKKIELLFDHVDGLSQLYLFDVAGLIRIDRSATDGTVRPVFREGCNIYKVYVSDGFSYAENMVHDDSGEAYDVQIQGFIPRIGQTFTIQQLEVGAWLAVIQDANGDVLLCGSQEVPLRFEGNKGTGSGRNGTAFTLKGVQPLPSAIIAQTEVAVLLPAE